MFLSKSRGERNDSPNRLTRMSREAVGRRWRITWETAMKRSTVWALSVKEEGRTSRPSHEGAATPLFPEEVRKTADTAPEEEEAATDGATERAAVVLTEITAADEEEGRGGEASIAAEEDEEGPAQEEEEEEEDENRIGTGAPKGGGSSLERDDESLPNTEGTALSGRSSYGDSPRGSEQSRCRWFFRNQTIWKRASYPLVVLLLLRLFRFPQMVQPIETSEMRCAAAERSKVG